MIPLLPLLVLAPQGHSASAKPEWLVALLRDAPPSLRKPEPSVPYFVGVGDSIGYDSKFGSGATASPSSAKPDPWKALQDRASVLLDGGRYEEAYRLERANHEDDDALLDYDRLPDAALLTGRYAEAQRLLVQAARLGPGSWAWDYDGKLRLCLASAAQGRVYPRQGAWVLGEIRDRLTFQYGPDGLAKRFGTLARYEAPSDSAGVAALSVLALGVLEDQPAYLEWTLRLDPRCVLAGTDLVEHYGYRHRPADAARVAASMVKALPPGKDRDGFAARLKELRAKGS